MQWYYGKTQKAVNEAFAGLTAEEAARLITGETPLSSAQADVLHRAGGSGYQVRMDLVAVGHLGFAARRTGGCGNRGHQALVPSTPRCRALVNRVRRTRFTALMGGWRGSDAVFSACKGWEPALKWAAEMYPFLAGCPAMSDRALRAEGFRPNHPHERVALAALRVALVDA